VRNDARADKAAAVRIVLDTNVILSALLWRGTPYRLLTSIRQQMNAQLFSSTPLLEELADVLTRPSAAKRLATINRSGADVLIDYVEAVNLVSPASIGRVVASDPDDDVVIATALAANANLIVSGDNDLLSLKQYQNIPILSPADALGLIEANK